MKFAFGFVTLLTIGVGSVLSQQGCWVTQCTLTASAANSQIYPLSEVQNIRPGYGAPNFNRPRRQASDYNAPPAVYETPSYNAPPPSYEAPTQPPKVLNPGRVVVMPPPGKAPQGFPQPGQPGGGALPETNPYIANMAPDGTVPIAIFPPFEKNPLYPTKCVIYSQLTDFEDLEINDYGNIQVDQVPQYSAPKEITYTTTPPPPPATNSYSAPVPIAYASSQPLQPAYAHQLQVVNTTNSYFRLGRRDTYHNNNNRQVRQSYYAPPPPPPPPPTTTTTTPTTTTTEAPPRIIYRQYGYVCEILVSIDVCYIGTECDERGNRLKSKNRFASYGSIHDKYQSRLPPTLRGMSSPTCVNTQAALADCRAAEATKQQYPGVSSP